MALLQNQERLRKTPTTAEKTFFDRLLDADITFVFQQVFSPYIVDFYLPDINTVIEIDGSSHDMKFAYDSARDAALRARGLKVIHIWNRDVQTFKLSKLGITQGQPKKWAFMSKQAATRGRNGRAVVVGSAHVPMKLRTFLEQ